MNDTITGRPKKQFCFSYNALAKVTRQKEETIRQHLKRGKFDPESLSSILEYINNVKERNSEKG